MKIAALDVGGTAIKSGVWDGEKLGGLREWETDAARGGECLMGRMKEIVRSYGLIDAIGVSTTGQVNTTNGSIYFANENVSGYTGMQVGKILRETFDVPVAVENDVNAAALGELHFGAARGERDFLCITIGTGVGGAIILNEKVYTGCCFSGGTFGGIVTHPEAVRPGKLYSGCFESFASTTALVRRVTSVDPSLDNGRKIFASMDRPEIQKQIDGWIDEIVYGLVTLIHIFNPSLIVMGGGVMAQPSVLREITHKIRPLLIPGFEQVKLRAAGLGNKAGLYGAVSLILREYDKSITGAVSQ